MVPLRLSNADGSKCFESSQKITFLKKNCGKALVQEALTVCQFLVFEMFEQFVSQFSVNVSKNSEQQFNIYRLVDTHTTLTSYDKIHCQ